MVGAGKPEAALKKLQENNGAVPSEQQLSAAEVSAVMQAVVSEANPAPATIAAAFPALAKTVQWPDDKLLPGRWRNVQALITKSWRRTDLS